MRTRKRTGKNGGPRAAKGKAPGRRKPRRAGTTRLGEIRTWPFQSCGGIEPLKRGPGRESGRCRPMARACLHARVPQGCGLGAGGGRGSKSQEGRGRREAYRSPQEEALKGGTPGARLVEIHQGDRGGSKASRPAGTAGTQRDPEEATPGVVARRGTVALWGRGTSGERCTHEVRASPGQTLKRGKSLREAGHAIHRMSCPGPGSRMVDEPRSGCAKPMRRQGPGDAPGGRPTARE
jgi:hypothetical protein